jgi:hypothetical protein
MKIPPNLSDEQQQGYLLALSVVFRILKQEKSADTKSPLFPAIDSTEKLLIFRLDLTPEELNELTG